MKNILKIALFTCAALSSSHSSAERLRQKPVGAFLMENKLADMIDVTLKDLSDKKDPKTIWKTKIPAHESNVVRFYDKTFKSNARVKNIGKRLRSLNNGERIDPEKSKEYKVFISTKGKTFECNTWEFKGPFVTAKAHKNLGITSCNSTDKGSMLEFERALEKIDSDLGYRYDEE